MRPNVAIFKDKNAEAFAVAAKFTSPLMHKAAHRLAYELKINGLFYSRPAIYPFIGDTSGAHQLNLTNPSYGILTYSGGTPTHSRNGIAWTSAVYANTGLTAANVTGQDSASMSFYTRDAVASAALMAGSTGSSQLLMLPSFSGASGSTDYSEANGYNSSPTGTGTTQGYNLVSRVISTQFKKFRNGVITQTTTANSVAPGAISIYIGGRNNNGSYIQGTTAGCCFASMGQGLSDEQASADYIAVQRCQTILQRNV